MAESSVVSTISVGKDACGQGEWIIKNWTDTHKIIVAAEASCYIEFGNPKIVLRFFLRPKEKLSDAYKPNKGYNCTIISKYYTLWGEVVTPVQQNAAVKVTAFVANAAGQKLLTKGNNR